MTKYTRDQRSKLLSAGKRLGLLEKKVTRFHSVPSSPNRGGQDIAPTRRANRKRQISAQEEAYRLIQDHGLKHLERRESIPAYEVDNPTRYPAAKIEDAGKLVLTNILRRYEYAMKPQGITPGDFKNWRQHFMLMSTDQLASLLRVTGRTIRGWESGKTKIPFSVWWVMHVTLQDPERFLTRPGFHDFYIDYRDGEARLCSYAYPEIRWSATDLYFNRCALNEVLDLRRTIEKQSNAYQNLEAENTRLRQLLKKKGISNELEALQEKISDLAKRLNTADVLDFIADPEQVLQFKVA